MSFFIRLPQSLKWLKVGLLRSGKVLRFPIAATFLASFLVAAYAPAQSFDNGFEDKNGDGVGELGGWDVPLEAEPGEVVIVGPESPQSPNEFPVYEDLNVEKVDPDSGEFMLRMGTPKLNNETQPRGINSISQTFTNSAQVSVSLWLFSLDHRGDDTLRFSLVSDEGDLPLPDQFFFWDGTPCLNPCVKTIDVGKRQDVINTGWKKLRFADLNPEQSYTLTIELEAGQNESLASWLYVDGGNEPPTAEIGYGPFSAAEGDYVVFDCLSVDPEGSDVSCTWWVDGVAGGEGVPGYSYENPLIGKTVVYAFPNSGSATINVEVSDGENIVSAEQAFVIEDIAPLVNALDVEVLAGDSVGLVCRWVDPGVSEIHLAQFTVGGVGSLVEQTPQVVENVPALTSGIARATYTAPDSGPLDGPIEIGGSCTVSGGGKSGSDPFTITILPRNDLASRIASNSGSTVGTPQELLADHSSLGGLADTDSVAVYEIRLPPRPPSSLSRPIPAGAEVVVTAHFPVDYDIAVFSGVKDKTINAAPWVSAPFVSAPFVSAPFVSVPFVSAPFVSAPFVSAPFVSAPFVSAPFVSAPFVSAPFVSASLPESLWLKEPGFLFENFPLSLLAGAPDGSNISGADVSFGDLGALSSGSLANEQVFLKGLSAEFGTNTEQLLVKVSPGEEGLYLAVIPQAGSFSSAPFNIEVEISEPPSTKTLLGAACEGKKLVDATLGLIPMEPIDDGTETLIVTQKERMMVTFGLDEAAWNDWMAGMGPFFDMVNAKVVSVPRELYDQADLNPCDIEAQNELARGIKAFIDENRTTETKYVQLMGSLDIIPPYYVPDETQTGNEALFASDLLTRPGTPLGVAISEGYMLTDAFYVDAVPQPFNGRELYLEDISVSRMVETPEEILTNAERYVNNLGVINVYTTQSTGYDFFIDGTEEVNAVLRGLGVPNTTRNDNTWDAKVLRCQFFGKGCDESNVKAVSALNAVNMHMSYNAGLTAKGFDCQYLDGQEQEAGSCANTSELGEVILSTESAGIYDVPDGFAINGVTFSIGCHSGLSVPDAWGLPEELGLPIDPARDWVQELGTWVGSYNFAYGDTDVADRGTEGILPLVIANFAHGEMTLGEALVQAKRKYGAGLFEFGVYDEKSLVGLNLFGMPQVRIGTGGGSPSPIASTGSKVGDLRINIREQGADLEPAGGEILEHTNVNGLWYSIDGDAQAIVGRPLLPIVKPFELREKQGTTIHGVALRGGTYTTNYPGDNLVANPVFPAQTHDLVTEIGEPQPCVETLSPSLIASVNRFVSGEETWESFIVQPGQFQCTDTPEQQQASGYEVNGKFRIWNTMTLELLHPEEGASDEDLKPPVVTQQDLLRDPVVPQDVIATLSANDGEDGSGIREIIALVYTDNGDGTGRADQYSVPPEGEELTLPVVFTLPDAYDKLLSFQYIDGAGNITAKTLKGALLRAIEVSIKTTVINQGGTTQIVVEISDFCSLVAPYLYIDFGDGNDTDPPIELEDSTCATDPDGSRTFNIEHLYTDLGGAASVTVKVEVRASGAVGTDEKTISACSDTIGDADGIAGADIIGCSVSPDGGNFLKIGVVIDGPLSADVQYRLALPQTNTQIKWTVDGGVTGPNKIKPTAVASGNVITFRFDAGKLGWNGVSPFEFLFETQKGVSGGQGQGFVDETEVKIYQP